jgi:hypothetical protein
MAEIGFLTIIDRRILLELFFDALLSDEDLSKLLCTCRPMKQMILEWKRNVPIKYLEIGEFMTDDKLFKLIKHYSNYITTLTIDFHSILTIKGYKHLILLKSNLIELSIQQCLGKGLAIISSSFTDLKTLRIAHCFKATNKSVDSLSRLTNLGEIELYDCFQNDISVKNYSSLINIASMTLIWCEGLTGKGLRYLVVNKEFLVQLKIKECHGIAAEGYHCLTTLTNLTNLTINVSQFDDIGLNMICSSCLLIEYLNVRKNDVTIEGFNNINCLINLKALKCNVSNQEIDRYRQIVEKLFERNLKLQTTNNNNLKIISSELRLK